MRAKQYPTKGELLKIFEYKNGELLWKNPLRKKCYIGKVVGHFDPKGKYRRVRINNSNYLVHRIIYIMHYGDISSDIQVDHIDRDRTNNRIENLRACDNTRNQYNRDKIRMKTNNCPKGVYPHKEKSRIKWKAKISFNGKEIYLGLFNTISEANEAYLRASREMHKNFSYK